MARATKRTAAKSTPKSAPEWKSFPLTEYRTIAADLVHFSTKTVDSNADGGGVRLPQSSALKIPYVSARTLMAAGITLELDYTKNSGKTATIVRQIHAVERGDDIQAASTAERSAIVEITDEVRKTGHEVGLKHVDAHLRQLLIPNENVDNGYVAITPLTAGGVCRVVNQAISTSNDTVTDASNTHRLRRARFGIGGSNPQNVGSLVRDMQRPLLLPSPREDRRLRVAFRLYYRGPVIDFAYGSLRRTIDAYAAFRHGSRVDGRAQTTMDARTVEEDLLYAIAACALQIGTEALRRLRGYGADLPREFEFDDGEYELISRNVDGVLRGLVDPRCRTLDYSGSSTTPRVMNWPRDAAQFLVTKMATLMVRREGEDVLLVPLDTSARATVSGTFEEYLRQCI